MSKPKPTYQIVKSAQRARTYVVIGRDRFEVEIQETYTDANGVLVAKVRFPALIINSVAEVEFSQIHTEAV